MEPFDNPDEKDRPKTGNKLLAMKLIPGHGAKFGDNKNSDLPDRLENEFLAALLAFEKQFEDHKMIKVFDKIGKPGHFKPVNEIPDDATGKAWSELLEHLNKYCIDLDVCSPNISARELYRFTTEELFEYEMDDMDLPGYTTNFIYDEFYPDPVYESGKAVKEDLFPALFNEKPVAHYFYCLHDENILLNGKLYPASEDVKAVFNHFKSFFSKIDLQQTTIDYCRVINTAKTSVTGNYKAVAILKDDIQEILFEGKFTIELQPDDLGYWSIKSMKIGEIAF